METVRTHYKKDVENAEKKGESKSASRDLLSANDEDEEKEEKEEEKEEEKTEEEEEVEEEEKLQKEEEQKYDNMKDELEDPNNDSKFPGINGLFVCLFVFFFWKVCSLLNICCLLKLDMIDNVDRRFEQENEENPFAKTLSHAGIDKILRSVRESGSYGTVG